MDAFTPQAKDRFTFGLWTVGNPGRDPFGEPVRPITDPNQVLRRLSQIGAWGVNLHDNDLVPFNAPANERDAIVSQFKATLDETGMVVPMTTTNLFSHPIFKDGAFTANDPSVRAFALRKTMESIDLGVELGAAIHVFWGGREGTDADACRDPRTAIARMRDGIDFLCAYCKDQGYSMRFALEAKPNEPRCDMYFPTTGHMLHFISTLEHSEMVGVNPEVAHETMAGLSMTHGVAQAMEMGKLFHIDLNGQKIGRYDQDLRFGSEDLKGAFLLVRLLEGTGSPSDPAGGSPTQWRYDGPLHFDAHAYRSEDAEGVWDFALGCMRTYKILKAKAEAFDADPEVVDLIKETANPTLDPLLSGYTPEKAAALRDMDTDLDALAAVGLRYERLDQLMIEHLLGSRG